MSTAFNSPLKSPLGYMVKSPLGYRTALPSGTPGNVLVLAAQSPPILMVSQDGFTPWTFDVIPNSTWAGLCYSPALNMFVSLDNIFHATTGLVMYSTNGGASWSTATVPAIECTGICWSPTLGIFVAVGESHTQGLNQVLTSSDGINWTQQSALNSSDLWTAVCWTGSSFVAVGQGTNKIMTSPDGVSWTARTPFTSGPFWGNVTSGGGIVVMTGRGNGVVINRSLNDGVTWTAALSTGGNQTMSGLAYGAGLFVTCDCQIVTFTNYTGVIRTSPDGRTWTLRSNPNATCLLQGVTWSPGLGRFISVTDLGSSFVAGFAVMTSPDGITWTGNNGAAGVSFPQWFSVACNQ